MNLSRVRSFLFLSLLLSTQLSAQAFRFAWLSDTHVGATTGTEDLRISIRDINSMTDIAFVLLSGDITEMGSNEQLRAAKSLLDSLRKPYYIVPGNHDTKWSESGATMFRKLWGNDRFVFVHNGFRFIGLHQGPLMKMGDGHWAPEDVRWLDSLLMNLPDKSQPFFLVTHYPADDGIANWYEVLDRVKKYNVQAFLVGHGHRSKKDSYEGVPGIMGRSNLRVRDSVGGYTIAEIDADTMTFSERTPGHGTKSPWHHITLGKREYGSVSTKFPRPDFSVNEQYPNIRRAWTFESGFTIASTPAVWKNLAVVGNSSGTVYGLSIEDGSVAWKFKTNGPVYSSPDISDGRVVLGSVDGRIYCLNAESGNELWRFQTDAAVIGCPRIKNGTVFIGGSDRKFRAIDLKSGRLMWEFSGLEGFVETKPVLFEGKVIFGAWDSFLYALDSETGKLAWKWKGDKPGVLLSPAACWPVVSHGRVYIVAPDRITTAIDVHTGQQLWRTADHQSRESIGLSADGERIYIRCMTDSIIAISTSSSRPDVVWATNAQFGYDISPASLVEKDGTVFYATKNGLLITFEGLTGKIHWKHRTGVALVNTVVPLSSTRVLATNLDGEVMLVEQK